MNKVVKKEAKPPYEYKTSDYKSQDLYLFVYHKSENGKPLSYGRIYKKSIRQINIINNVMEKWYRSHLNNLAGDGKLHFTKLCNLTKLHATTLRELLLKMASVQEVLKRKDGKWTKVRDKPYIILQQKAKNVSRQGWGKKSCVYCMPYWEIFLPKG
ncbi:MAG: hypothetical protein ACOCZQ_02030 [Nanoarchaeota archaeon]